MAAESATSLVGDLRKLLQDVITPDLKALAARVDGIEKQLDVVRQDVQLVKQDVQLVRHDVREVRDELRQLNERQEKRFDRLMSALDVYKDVQDLKEFRIRTEERQKASA